MVCLRGTDTALAFRGEAEWLTAGLNVLGVPMDQAASTVETFFHLEMGAEPGKVLGGEHEIVVRVCADCVAKSGRKFPSPGLLAFGVPVIAPKSK